MVQVSPRQGIINRPCRTVVHPHQVTPFPCLRYPSFYYRPFSNPPPYSSRPLRPTLPVTTAASLVLARFIVPRHLLISVRTRLAPPPLLAFTTAPLMIMRVGMVIAVVPMPMPVVPVPKPLLSTPAPPFHVRVRVRVGIGGIGGGLVARLAYSAGAVVDAAYYDGRCQVSDRVS